MKSRLFLVFAVSFLLVFSLSFLLTSFTPMTSGTSDPPTKIHLTWQQSDTAHTITATWETTKSDSGDTVLYDTLPRNGIPESYSFSTQGTNHSYSGASGYLHDVELTGLTPDSVYYFICGGDTGGWSSERAFRTGPSISSDVRFVVGGDSRTNWAERTKISEAMARFNPAFVMHSGDMVADGCVQSQWDSWFTDVHENWIGENNLTIPIMPVLGNHENPNDPNTKYFVQFALPDNERWYSYDWGPDIHIICLDSESSASGDQLTWLQNDLSAHANSTWKFVIFHKPPFVSGSHSPWTPAITHWVPLFDKYHVNLVFNGHEHSYHRTYPLNWTASQTEPQDYSNGTTYVISGGWGAPLYTPEPIWYMAYQNKTYHFVLIDVFRNGTLHMQAKDDTGNTFDEVWIYGSVPARARVSIPLSGWLVDPRYTNAPYVLNSTGSSLYLELDAANTTSRVTIRNLGVPKLNLSEYDYVDVEVDGSGNARILMRFFLDDGSGFDVAYWADPATLDATLFDLGPYAGRTLRGDVYIALKSSDGTMSNVTITEISFVDV